MDDYTSGPVRESAFYDEDESKFFAKDDRAQDIYLRTNYGITLHDYQAQMHRQKYRCEICKRKFTKERIKPHVDHDHSTGAVRGILCNYCNYGLGNFQDDENRLLGAVMYLLKYRRG